jgi:DNA-binding response OmpR family regulator
MRLMAVAATILVVDDEERLRELLRGYLVQAGFAVLLAADGVQALELARAHRPDLVVLDLMLPGTDGIEVCRRLRTFSDAYVVMLTARAEEIDRVIGLEVGADDYVTKPFSPRELVARVRAMLRRPRGGERHGGLPAPPGEPDAQAIGPLRIDDVRHEVTLDGHPLALTATEYGLLATLAAHPGRAFTRAQLLEQVWGTDYFGDDHVVDVHIANLRRKLGEEPGQPRLIETVRGVGYRLKAAPA